MLLELFPFVILNNAMAFVYAVFSLTFLRLLLTVTLQGYLISISCLLRLKVFNLQNDFVIVCF